MPSRGREPRKERVRKCVPSDSRENREGGNGRKEIDGLPWRGRETGNPRRGGREEERQNERRKRDQRTMIGSTALIFLTWFSLSSKMLMEMPDCWPHRRHTRLDSRVSMPRALSRPLVVAPLAPRRSAHSALERRDVAYTRVLARFIRLALRCCVASAPSRSCAFPLVCTCPRPTRGNLEKPVESGAE